MSVERHEATHAAMAIWLRRPIEYLERYPDHFLPGETMGHCRAPIEGAVEASQVAIALAGYMGEEAPDWPPDFEQARHERLEGLGRLIEILGFDHEQYEAIVAVTHRILDDPDFIRLRDAIERALRHVPRLDAQAVRDLTEAAGIPVPEPEGVTP